MSTIEEKREETVEKIADVKDELQLIAEKHDGKYADYAENALDTLREAGYDV